MNLSIVSNYSKALLFLLCSFSISFIICYSLIIFQKKRKVYQPVRNEVSSIQNQNKIVPSLGGIGILLSIILSFIIVDIRLIYENIFYLLILSGFFVIGLIDDLLKLIFNNHRGMNGFIRIFFEGILGMLLIKKIGYQFIDFQLFHFSKISVFLGTFSIFLLLFALLGTANGMNLCDGVDALASLLYIIAIMPFCIYAFKINNLFIGYLLIASFGSTIGFLCFNIHPSKLFMGDCGSLLLGAIISSSSILLRQEGLLLVSGIVLIVEALSVIIQVLSFQIRKKRVFLMAPLHHHLEMKGISEEKIVIIFAIVGYIASLITIILML